MSLWFTETFEDKVRFGLKVKETLFKQQSDYQLVEVFDTEQFGRTLTVDGIFMTSEGDEFYYHEMLVHPAMCVANNIADILIIGGGDGGTAREALRHPEVERVRMVEIDAVVVEACKQHMPGFAAWDDPRLTVDIADGIDFVANADEDSFDVVLLDGSDPVGPAKGLFGVEFYKNVRRVLRPGGVFALQSETPTLFPDVFRDIVTALRELFDRADPYFGSVPIYGGGAWTWTLASDGVDPLAIIDRRAEAIEAVSKLYNRGVHRGAFALPQQFVRELGPLR